MTLSETEFNEQTMTRSKASKDLAPSVTQDEDDEHPPEGTNSLHPVEQTTSEETNWSNLTIDNFVTELQTATTEQAVKYHKALATAQAHVAISNASNKASSYDPTAISSAIANQGLKWKPEDEWTYIADEFKLMQAGRTAWLKQATDRLLRGDASPNAYLVRTSQEDHYDVIWGRGQIFTPCDCNKPARNEAEWLCYIGNGTRNHQPKTVILETGRTHEKLFNDKVKIISCDEVLREPRQDSKGTIVAGKLHDVLNGIPLLCPLPWTWAGVLLAHPTWSCQDAARWMAQRMLAWPVDDQLVDVQTTMITVWKFLCASATAKSSKQPNCRNLLPVTSTHTDAGLDMFLRNHAARYWWDDVTDEPDEEEDEDAEAPTTNTTTMTTAAAQPTVAIQTATNAHSQQFQPKREQPPRQVSQGVLPPPTVKFGVLPPPTDSKLPPKPMGLKRPTGTPPGQTPKRVKMSLGFESTLDNNSDDEPDQPEGTSNQPPPGAAPEDIANLLSHPSGIFQAISALATATMASHQRESDQQAMFLQQLKAVTDNTGTATAEKQRWNKAKQARIAAWAGLPMNSPTLPPFWPSLLQAASNDKDATIQTLVNELATEHMEFTTWVPHPQFFEDLKKMMFYPQHPSAKNWHRGLTPMAFADRDVGDIRQAQQKKEFWDQFGANIRLSNNDAGVVESKAPASPLSAEKLCLYTTRWLIFHKKTLGSHCGLYEEGKKAYAALLLLMTRIFNTPDFMGRRGASIMWELGHGTRNFYKQIYSPDQFAAAAAQNAAPPKAHISLNVAHLMNLDGSPAGDLPYALRTVALPPVVDYSYHQTQHTNTDKGGSGSSGGKSNNGSNTNRDGPKGAHRDYRQATVWTPAFQQLFGGYSRSAREKLKLGAICRDGRKSVHWISERLNLAKGTCCTSVVLGQCPPTCRLPIHDAKVDDAKAAEVATVLAPSVTKVAKAAGVEKQ